jgi:hypothetical protein
MRNMRISAVALAALLLSTSSFGCGSQPTRLPTYPVHGEIVCADKPAVGVRIFLVRADAKSVPEVPMNPHAVTGDDGRFSVSTYDKEDGAPAGEYFVVLNWPTNVHESREDRLRGLFDKKKIAASIKPGSDNLLPAIKLPTVDVDGKPLDARPHRDLAGG